MSAKPADRSVFKQFLSIKETAQATEDSRGYKSAAIARPVLVNGGHQFLICN